MGLSRVDDSEWLVVDDHRDEELALKRALLPITATRSSSPCRTSTPPPPAPNCSGCWFAVAPIAATIDPEFEGALERAALSVQEDLCVLLPDEHGRLVLAAACVCFPSHWRLADKMGKPAWAIHGPVPRYDDELARKVDTFLDRLRPPAVMKRRNWTIHESADLFAPARAGDADPAIPPEDLWLRSERQTLRRLPDTDAVVFTIRTQQVQIAGACSTARTSPASSPIASTPSPMTVARYAGFSAHVPALVHRLRSWRS